MLRLDPQVYDDLRVWADDDLRSLNAQIEFLLRDAVNERGRSRKKAAKKSRHEDEG